MPVRCCISENDASIDGQEPSLLRGLVQAFLDAAHVVLLVFVEFFQVGLRERHLVSSQTAELVLRRLAAHGDEGVCILNRRHGTLVADAVLLDRHVDVDVPDAAASVAMLVYLALALLKPERL